VTAAALNIRTGFGPQATVVGVSSRAVAATALVEALEKAKSSHAEALLCHGRTGVKS
jgi:hypothetical protein